MFLTPEVPLADRPPAGVACPATRETAPVDEDVPVPDAGAAAPTHPAELDQLLRELRPRIYRFVLARLVDRHLAEDVTQEVLVTLVATLSRCHAAGRPVPGWAFGIAVRKVSEAHRTLRRRPEDTIDDVPDRPDAALLDDPERAALHLDSTRRLAQLLAALPAVQADIVRLRVAAGLSADETAAALGLTPGAVRVAQHRALAKLREMMRAQTFGGPEEVTP